MLQRILDTLDGLSDEVKAFYKPGKGDLEGKFVLHVDGKPAEDVTALKNAKDHEKNLRVATEGERDALKDQNAILVTERDTAVTERDAAKADKGQDVAALEASWSAKVDAEKAGRETEKADLTREIERLLVSTEAARMAAEISTVPELFEETIAKRLKVEKGADGKYFTRVLDLAGAPSAATLDDLKKELLANEKYAAIIIAGKGSGGGAGGLGSGGGAAEKKWLEHSDEELVELRRTDPEKYERLRQAHQAEAAKGS